MEQEKLPLIVEVLPGSAGEGFGLIRVFEWGSCNLAQPPQEYFDRAVQTPEGVEEQSIIRRIQQERPGNLLVGAASAPSATVREIGHHLEIRDDEEERYAYLRLRYVKPQEGGTRRARG